MKTWINLLLYNINTTETKRVEYKRIVHFKSFLAFFSSVFDIPVYGMTLLRFGLNVIYIEFFFYSFWYYLFYTVIIRQCFHPDIRTEHVFIYIHMFIYVYLHTYMCLYLYVYIEIKKRGTAYLNLTAQDWIKYFSHTLHDFAFHFAVVHLQVLD